LLYLDYFFTRSLLELTHDLHCAQLLDTETKRKIKKEPALAVEMRADLFTSNVDAEGEGTGGGDVISDLWNFS
jgi:hypothetical protein